MNGNATVVGAGPNGLAAANVLARAGLTVEVLEAQSTIGGGARTMELTLPGFLHDFGSAVHPMAAGSPIFRSLKLDEHGLEWIHSPAMLAHPLDDGTAVLLYRDMAETVRSLGKTDGATWRQMMGGMAHYWDTFADDVLGPMVKVPHHPMLMTDFAVKALLPASVLVQRFLNPRTRALLGGLAAHSMLSLDAPMSSAVAMALLAAGHAVGWPVPRGGAQAITDALVACLRARGGSVAVNRRVHEIAPLLEQDAVMCDVVPSNLLKMAGERFSPAYRRRLQKFRQGTAAYKVDYALSEPIPWAARDCAQAATVHLGGTFAEIEVSESAVSEGRTAVRPFVLLAQPSLFDATRAPAGKHTAWAYCHVPNGSAENMLPRIEAQIERFAPGFLDCVLARNVLGPVQLEQMDANLVGGDIGGGAFDLGQTLRRPALRPYNTSLPNVFLCSSSTPPGGGVHGMCGFNAAQEALRYLKARELRAKSKAGD